MIGLFCSRQLSTWLIFLPDMLNRPTSRLQTPQVQINTIYQISRMGVSESQDHALRGEGPLQQTEGQSQSIRIQLILYTNQNINFSLSKTSIVRQIKQLIFKKYCDQLKPKLMILTRNGKILNDSQHIFSQDCIKSNQLQITQRKAQIWQLGLKGDCQAIDPIFLEKGVVQLKCKHAISRKGFIATLQYQINTLKRQEIYCPFLLENGKVCFQSIDRQYYQLFAGYSKDQWEVVSVKLSQNFLLNNSTICPGCRHSILKNGITEKRVNCPVCECTFCFQCSQKWIGNGNDCISQRCQTIAKLIASAPWDRVFRMYHPKDSNNRFEVCVPNLRACPVCKALLRNTAYCKHIICALCQSGFCFVCLKIRSNTLPCGGPFEYCGFVAPNQNLNITPNLRADK